MKYGLIGKSLKHSFSKEIHEKLAGYDYELKELSEEELEGFLREASFNGINVTIPYKKSVIPFLDEISDRARRIGAVNTVVNLGGFEKPDGVTPYSGGDSSGSGEKSAGLFGDNTDYAGLKALVLRVMPGVRGAKVLILGTGGTSLTAKVVCEDLGAGEIWRVSRNANAGAEKVSGACAERIGAKCGTAARIEGKDCVISYEEAAGLHFDADLIINTTPVGMFPKIDDCPINLEPFTNLKGVVDVVYNPLRTKLVLDARSRGISAEGGLFMLVAQAEAASKLFLSPKKPNEDLIKSTDSEFENRVSGKGAENGEERTSTRVENVFNQLIFDRQNLVLTGMPGAGKTTVGMLLAKKLSRKFVDTDQAIFEKTGRTPAQIIRDDGEPEFRSIESEVIFELAALTGVVIATGGGAVLRKENVSALKQNGKIIFINTPVEKLKATSDRPLSDTVGKLRELYEKRRDCYLSTADLVVENRGSAEDACSTIMNS